MDETQYQLYQCKAGDTFDSLAFDFYTDEKKASKIIEANTEYADMLIFEGGEILAIPLMEENEEAAATTPPWRQ